MRSYLIPLTLLLAALATPPARAQTFEFSPVVAYQRMSKAPLGSLNANPRDNDTRFGTTIGYGGRVTWNTQGYYGHELGYILNRARLETEIRNDAGTRRLSEKIRYQQAFYNFMMYMMPNGEVWRPYITVGAQLQQYNAPGFPEWTVGDSRNYGINWGGGLKIKPSRNFLFRLDGRHYIGGKPFGLRFETITDSRGFQSTNEGGRVHQFEASAGIAFVF